MSALPKRSVTLIVPIAEKTAADRVAAVLGLADSSNTFVAELSLTPRGVTTHYWSGMILTERQYSEFSSNLTLSDIEETRTKTAEELRAEKNLVRRTG